jgi:hypothetical protein
MPTEDSRGRQAAPIAAEDAEQHFRFIERTMYQMACVGAPIIALLALAAGNYFHVLNPKYFVFLGCFLLLNVGVLLNYRFRRHSLSAWVMFLLAPTLSIVATMAGIMFLDMVFGDPGRPSARLLGEQIITIEIVSVLFFAVGFLWAFYGNRRSVRQAELTAALGSVSSRWPRRPC